MSVIFRERYVTSRPPLPFFTVHYITSWFPLPRPVLMTRRGVFRSQVTVHYLPDQFNTGSDIKLGLDSSAQAGLILSKEIKTSNAGLF